MFNKRHDVGFLFFLPSVHTCSCKRILHKKNFRKALWQVTPSLDLVEETSLQSIYLWAWLVGKEWSSRESCPSLWKEGKTCTTCLRLNKVQLKFHQSCGEILSFLLYCFNEMEKKIFWKAIFYLIWQIPPSSATTFPRCSLCNHMVQLLLKE